MFCGLAWRDAILRAGGEIGRVDACARYGVGSFVNSVAPAHLGDLVRAVLLLEKLPAGGRRRIVPWFGVIQGARLAALAALAIAAALPGLLIVLALAIPVALLVVARSRGTAQLVCLSFLSPLAKAAAIAVVLVGLDVGSPLDALAVVPALELAALLPLTPGNVGVAGAAASGALLRAGPADVDRRPGGPRAPRSRDRRGPHVRDGLCTRLARRPQAGTRNSTGLARAPLGRSPHRRDRSHSAGGRQPLTTSQ